MLADPPPKKQQRNLPNLRDAVSASLFLPNPRVDSTHSTTVIAVRVLVYVIAIEMIKKQRNICQALA